MLLIPLNSTFKTVSDPRVNQKINWFAFLVSGNWIIIFLNWKSTAFTSLWQQIPHCDSKTLRDVWRSSSVYTAIQQRRPGVYAALCEAKGGWCKPLISDPERLSTTLCYTHGQTHAHARPHTWTTMWETSQSIKGGHWQMLTAAMVGLLYRGTRRASTASTVHRPRWDLLASPCRKTSPDS